jgi:hypothetical protein
LNKELSEGGVYCFGVDPFAPTTLYAGVYNKGVSRSFDGGSSWEEANAGLTAKHVRCFGLDPLIPATLYAGTWYEGPSKSDYSYYIG